MPFILAAKLLLGGWLNTALTFLKSLPWQVWLVIAAVILLAVAYFHGERQGETKGAAKVTAQVEKDHTANVKMNATDTTHLQSVTAKIDASVKHSNQLATEYAAAKIEDMHNAIAAQPSALAGTGTPPPFDDSRMRTSINALIDRANGAAEAADAGPGPDGQ